MTLVQGLAPTVARSEDPSQLSCPEAFEVGERAVYELWFGPLKAGEMTLEIVEPAGDGVRRFRGRVVSSRLVNVFYRVDDRAESWVQRGSFLPLRLELEVDESGERGRRRVRYDHDAGVAQYHRHRTYHRKRGPSTIEREDPLPVGARDAVSLFFYLRCLDLEPGDTLEVPVHENGKNRQVRVRVGEAEMVATGLGRRRALPLEVGLLLEGSKLAAKRDLRLWLDADDRRLPLRFSADLAFGNLSGVLREVSSGDPPLVAAAR